MDMYIDIYVYPHTTPVCKFDMGADTSAHYSALLSLYMFVSLYIYVYI